MPIWEPDVNHPSKVLLVDDVPTNIQILADALEADHELFFAMNGQQALEIARLESPDLVLLDVMMPGMDGFDVRRAMDADPALAAIPVIFVTASDDKDDEARGLSLGGVDFITKPFNPTLVALRVRNQIELKRQRDQLAAQTVALQQALNDVKTLSGLLPMCAWCRKIRDDRGYWTQLEAYLAERSDARVSHGICPDCRKRVSAEASTDISVLYFTDAEADAPRVTDALEPLGSRVRVTAVRTWTEFTAALRAYTHRVVLSGYRVDGSDGLSALRASRTAAPNVPFIFVSDSVGEDAVIEALRAGATDFVLTPRLSRLAPAVTRAIQEAEERAAHARAEYDLRSSELRFRALFERSAQAILIADAATGEILDCNQSFLSLCGYDRHELLGWPATMLAPTDDAPWWPSGAPLWPDADGSVRVAARLVTKSGDLLPVSIDMTSAEVRRRRVWQAAFEKSGAPLPSAPSTP